MKITKDTLRRLQISIMAGLCLGFLTWGSAAQASQPACTTTQNQRLSQLMEAANLGFAEAALAGIGMSTPQEMSQQALIYGQWALEYDQDIYVQMPACASGLWLGELAAVLYDQTTASNLLIALLTYETDYGGAEDAYAFALALAELMTPRFESTEIIRERLFERSRVLLIERREADSPLPQCVGDDSTLDALRDLQSDYDAWLLPAFNDLLQDPETPLDPANSALTDAEGLALRLAEIPMPGCAPALQTWFEDHRLYIKSANTLMLARLWHYESEFGEPTTSRDLQDLLLIYQEGLAEKLEARQSQAQ